MLALDVAPADNLTGWRAHQELIDALPYVDPLTTSEQRAVDQLIEEEVRQGRRCFWKRSANPCGEVTSAFAVWLR